MYDQRLNGRLRGASDFRLTTGLERGLPGNWSLEAAVRHMCRHETSRDNPVIFDVNEVLGILRLCEKDFTIGLGFGGYRISRPEPRRLVTPISSRSSRSGMANLRDRPVIVLKSATDNSFFRDSRSCLTISSSQREWM